MASSPYRVGIALIAVAIIDIIYRVLFAKVHKNLETAKHTPLVFCLETVKNIGKIYPYQRILAKYQGKRD